MCIFSGPVTNVSSTKILVSYVFPSQLVFVPNANGRPRKFKKKLSKIPMQLVVYSNKVGMNAVGVEPVAMVLPFPTRGRKPRVKLLDFSNYEEIFDDLEKMFPSKKSRGVFANALAFESSDTLEVHHVGSYKASVVPSLAAFDRLQYNQFGLSPEVKNLLSRYYSRGYGFVVCIIKGGAKYHPFGYAHELRKDGRLFVPTRHYHGHSDVTNKWDTPTSKYERSRSEETGNELADFMQRSLMIEDKWMQHKLKRTALGDHHNKADLDWDHEIYVINAKRAATNNMFQQNFMNIHSASSSKLTNYLRYLKLGRIPRCITFGRIGSLQKISVSSGYRKNHDIVI